MFKTTPYKIMTGSALAAVITCSSIGSTYALAAETTTPVTSVHLETQVPKKLDNYLGPDGLKQALKDTQSNAFLLDVYATTVLKTADFSFDKTIFSTQADKNLLDTVIKNQAIAKKNAKDWIDTLKPGMLQVNQDTINYGTRFNGYYDTILTAIDAKDTTKVRQAVENLYKSIQKNKETVQMVLTSLKTFRGKLITDTTNFKESTTLLSSKLSGNSEVVKTLQTSIEKHQQELKESIDSRLSLGLTIPMSWIPLAGIGLWIAYAVQSSGISGHEEVIADLTNKMNEAEKQSTVLQQASNTSQQLAKTIDTAIDAVQSLSDQWNVMDVKYKSLLDNIEMLTPEDFTFIKTDLQIAKESWLDIKSYATLLYINLKQTPGE